MSDFKLSVILEVKKGERWCPVRIAHEFPNFHAALNSMPTLAKQQRTGLDCVRVRVLSTEKALYDAEIAIIEYNREIMEDPRR